MRVEFLKRGYYKGKIYKKGDICDMTNKDTNIYEEFKTAKKYFGTKKPGENVDEKIKQGENEIDSLNYKELQNLCKEKNLPCTGKKDELIEYLKNVEVN
jgi:hypothetical protein